MLGQRSFKFDSLFQFTYESGVIFATYWFFLFAVGVITTYWCLPWRTARLYFLVAASAAFEYHFAGNTGFLTILLLALLVYVVGLTRQNLLLILAMVICTGALVLFKYTHFITLDLLALFSSTWSGRANSLAALWLPAAAPLAISFFTFEFIHYLYDVKHQAEPVRRPLDFAIFILYFPTLVAGPIKRFENFVPQLRTHAARFSWDDIGYGLIRVAIGFFKKVVIADLLTSIIQAYDTRLDACDLATRWSIFLFLGFRIYMDFSGYSDIAIGLSRMLGFRLPENFNWPYAATNLQDFWHRWHISLSSWIRDYIYIPLGGSRHGWVRRGFNVFLAFALCGLWHGPQWNFVLWGVMHGIGLCTVVLYGKIPVLGAYLHTVFLRVPYLNWTVTMSFIFFSWILFFYPLDKAYIFLKLLFSVSGRLSLY